MKKLIKLLIIFILLFTAGYFLLNYYFLPYKAKDLITEKLSESLKREVTIEKLSYSMKNGIVLDKLVVNSNNLSVSNNQTDNSSLLSSERVSFNVLLLPLLIQRKVIITDLNVDSPQIILNKLPDGIYNISDILKPAEKKSKKKYSFMVASASINNGTLIYTDYNRPETYSKEIKQIYFNYGYLPPTSIRYKLSFLFPEKNSNCVLKGAYNIKSKDLSLSGNTESIPLDDINLAAGRPFEYKALEGEAITEITATLNSQKYLLLDITSNLKDLNLDKTSYQIKGNADTTINIEYDFKKKELTKLEGVVRPKNLSVEGLPYAGSFSEMTGKAKFDRQKVNIEEINGNLLGCPTQLKGVVNIKDLYLKLDAKSDLQLEKALEILPKANKEKFKNLKLTGKTYAALKINGSLRQMISLDITGDISLTDVAIKQANSKFNISSASGKIFLSKDKAEINDIHFDFMEKTYNLNAILSNFKNPLLDFKIISDNFFTTGKISINNSSAHIEKIKGNYYAHTFELTGDIEDLSKPNITLYGDLEIDAPNLDKILPANLKNVSNLELKGKIPGSLHFQGELAKWKEAVGGFKANADKLQIKGLNLTNLYINTTMQNGDLILKNFTFAAYDGIFAMTGEMALTKQNVPYNANIVLKNLSLEKLIKDTKLKDKEIKGFAFLKMQLRNPYKDISGITGDGGLIIIDGYLMQLPILDTMAKLLGIPVKEKITFKEAYADFTIKNQTISSDNITLTSEGFDIKSQGTMDFKGNIDFLSNAEFSEEKYKELNTDQQIGSLIFNFANKYITRIRSTGHIGSVQHKIEPASPNELLNEGLKGLKGIGEIFGL